MNSPVDPILGAGERTEPVAYTTREGGQPVPSENISITAGPQGASVLNDLHLIEKLAHFNRERVPERNPHAKGHGAFGELHITEDVSAYTKAKLFQKGTVTPMAIRFSTVAGEQGSPDTWRDVHGFALRFWTQDGNYDIVGNNTPTFFLRDAIKFPDFIHSQKRLGRNGLRDADMQWDFWTRTPESAHQVTYLMGDRGTPKTSRHQDGFGSHTFQWINEEGKPVWVKYHFKSRQGWDTFTDAEAQEMAGKNADHHREDLYNAIAHGDFPIWDVKVQIMPFEDAENYRWNPFDLTKTWSQKDYPLVDVGYFVLNRNPKNFFTQIEQLALDPSNLVPGVGLSPDRMLMARAFAYADAQRTRIGTNYRQLPINQPVVPVNTYEHEGAMAYQFNPADAPVYSPNRYSKGAGYLDDGETSSSGITYGQASDLFVNPDPHGTDLTRAAYVKHAEDDDFIQAGILYREVFDDGEKERFVDNVTNAMAGISPEVEERVYWYWTQVDANLGAEIKRVFATKK
ncbi:catalase [Corynebacterium pseudotuberculosis]|uniref:catalase n=1 Tax=Corynebacterium pseudotuberculosis TaxID=1719 RepID=UPI00023248EE|nr:catalase [Corynebacterium pseudotuberculosis]AER68285.1 Catalase [Corynebacterium pseudotuberculosis 1/06-A]AFB71520.1 catalase [Corynebacterium pseudotuberculosis 316]AKS12532.1 Catalase [Corynebacterium pseudotuberculosis]AMN69283.1 catalase [Corynebacterium pseudotuberculosis]AMN71126.1 catalase [Corynebacterium pseudotuberculosis]